MAQRVEGRATTRGKRDEGGWSSRGRGVLQAVREGGGLLLPLWSLEVCRVGRGCRALLRKLQEVKALKEEEEEEEEEEGEEEED